MYAVVAGNFGQVTKLQKSGVHVLRSVEQVLVRKHQVFPNDHHVRNFCWKRPASRPKLSPCTAQHYQVRTIVQPPRKFTPKYHADQVPKDYEMIYQSNIGKKHVKILFFIGFVAVGYVGLIAYFIFLFNGDWEGSDRITLPVLELEVSSLKFMFLSAYIVFSVLWTGITLKFAKLPVQRIYECPDKMKYVGILKKSGFGTERVEFTLKDVAALPVKSGQILRHGNATIQGRPCLLYATDFKTPSYFNKFLGYDPPQRL